MLSQTVLDVPPRIRLLLIIAGMIGIGLIGMESLVGNRPETIPIDKIITSRDMVSLPASSCSACGRRCSYPSC
jgi:hypothetical protein